MRIKYSPVINDKHSENADTNAEFSGRFQVCRRKLREYGFVKYRSSSLIRFSKTGILEVIGFHRQKHGANSLIVTLYAFPLCTDNGVVPSVYVERLGGLYRNKGLWWSYDNDDDIREAFNEIENALISHALPFFSGFDDIDKTIELFDKHKHGIDTALYCTYLCAIRENNILALKYLDFAEQALENSITLSSDRRAERLMFIKKWRTALLGNDCLSFIKKLENNTIRKLNLPIGMIKKFMIIRGYIKDDDSEKCIDK